MKSLARRFGLVAAFAVLAWSGNTTAVFAAEQDRVGPGDRLERLERRVNEMAQRQEQFLRQSTTQQERQRPMMQREGNRMRGRMPMPGLGEIPHPQTPPGMPAPQAMPVPSAPKVGKQIADLVKLCVLLGMIFNILVAVWIFTDIRKRGEGSGLFVALALLAGIPAAIIYAIVRIGDKKP
ncbi:MAG: hypothetical protein WCL11_26945 [Verrucomicrobiota bacterium]